MAIGRPSIYTPELAAKICTRLANGESLRSVCRDPEMPEVTTVLGWAFKTDHPFVKQYEVARDMQADYLAAELQDIADDGSNDWMERETREGRIEIIADKEHIQRSRLRVDTRKWIASKLKPKRYADKTNHEHSGKILLGDYVAASMKEDGSNEPSKE